MNPNEVPNGRVSISAGVWQRLHVATLILPILASLPALTPLIIVLLVFFARNSFAVVGLWVLIPALALAHVVRYATFRYQVNETEIVIQEGLFWRQERRIPVSRIQRVEIKQSVFHRILGLARAEISTAGSEEREAVLDTISNQNAQALKQVVEAARTRGRSLAQDRPDTGLTLMRLRVGTLLLGGVTSRAAATFAALIGVILYFQGVAILGSKYLRGIDPRALDPLVNWPRYVIPGRGIIAGRAVEFFLDDTLAKSALLVLGGFVLALFRYVTRHAGYELRQAGDVLTKTQGLLKRETSTLARERVQALKVEEGLLRRWFGLADAWIDSGGDRSKVDDKKKRTPFVPVAPRKELDDLICKVFPRLATVEPFWKKVSPKAILRGCKKGWLALVLVMAGTAVPLGWFALAFLPGFPLVYLLSLRRYHHTGYWIDADYVMSRRGWFNRETLYCPVRNIQNVSLSESPFDRRLGLASIVVDTAGQTNTGGAAIIRNLPMEEARRIQQTLAMKTIARRSTGLPGGVEGHGHPARRN